MSEATIYHNAQCSKSRATLEILRDQNIAIKVIEYLKTPPTESELANILDLLGLEPQELMRKGESAYNENGLADESLDRVQLIRAMVADPILIERPIVLANGKARIGRPPESVLEIL